MAGRTSWRRRRTTEYAHSCRIVLPRVSLASLVSSGSYDHPPKRLAVGTLRSMSARPDHLPSTSVAWTIASPPCAMAATVAATPSGVSGSLLRSTTFSPCCRKCSTYAASCCRPRSCRMAAIVAANGGGDSRPSAAARSSAVRCRHARWLPRSVGDRWIAPSTILIGHPESFEVQVGPDLGERLVDAVGDARRRPLLAFHHHPEPEAELVSRGDLDQLRDELRQILNLIRAKNGFTGGGCPRGKRWTRRGRFRPRTFGGESKLDIRCPRVVGRPGRRCFEAFDQVGSKGTIKRVPDGDPGKRLSRAFRARNCDGKSV